MLEQFSNSILFFRKKPEIWYSVKDGSWSDSSTWSSAGKNNRTRLPRLIDTVVIATSVTVDQNVTVNNINNFGNISVSSNATVNNITGFGGIIFDTIPRVLTVNNSCQITGILNMSSGNANHNLVLNGVNNYIENSAFVTGTGSIVTYGRNGDQDVLRLTYMNLFTFGSGIKNLISDLTVNGNLNINSNGLYLPENRTEFNNFNVNIGGTTIVNGYLSKSGSGNMIYGGRLTVSNQASLIFSGNPTSEYRNGFTLGQIGNMNLGNGSVTFSTNNQTIDSGNSPGSAIFIAGDILIKSGITLTHVSRGVGYDNVSMLYVSGVVNGESASSTFNNNANFVIANTQMPMQVGVFNHRNIVESGIGFAMNGSITLPYTTFGNLLIGGPSGVKSLAGNTLVEGGLRGGINSGSDLQLGSNNLQVNRFSNNNLFSILKNSLTGTTIFNGLLTFHNTNSIQFNGADLELRGGFGNSGLDSPLGSFGSGKFRLTTNNQSILGRPTAPPEILIEGVAVTISATGQTFPVFTNIVNGTNASSILDNRSTGTRYLAVITPMATGQLQCNNASNTFIYDSGNQDIKSGTYRTLTFGGSGVKRLLGNIIINTTSGGSVSRSGCTINYNGFTIQDSLGNNLTP